MVWKTNFDQIPYQDFLESRQQKATNSASSASATNNTGPIQQQQQQQANQKYSTQTSTNGNNNANSNNNNNNVIHARPNTVVNSLATSSQMRDQSPITIPLNESLVYQNDESNNSNEFLQSLDPTGAALMKATKENKIVNANIHQNRPNSKKLSFVSNGSNGSNASNSSNGSNGNLSNSSDKTGNTLNSGTGSILKKVTTENEINTSIPPNLTNTLEHIVQQLDILTQVRKCEKQILGV